MAPVDTSLEMKLGEVALEAGFQSGRRMVVSFKYEDVDDAQKVTAYNVHVIVGRHDAAKLHKSRQEAAAVAKAVDAGQGPFDKLLALGGKGRTRPHSPTHEELLARIREFRGDE
ncbi:hypothetical protein [Nitrospirillum viridazoti]|uniref:hypothetical protein n=1 Tax=Nitrospirillum viridazoti TaxID=3144925 RepID=UPI0011A3D2E1|nr:hypothetical protein [Nitrospirillum amazonense]